MSQRGFLTPADDHEGLMLAPLWLYGGVDWEAIPRGVLTELLHTWNYEALPGDKTIEETVEVYQEALARTFRQWSIHQPYHARAALLKTQSLIAQYTLSEDAAAQQARDLSGHGYHGAVAGAVGFDQAGMGDGLTSLYLNASGEFINIYSAGLAGAVNPDEGTFCLWAEADNWAQLANQYMLSLSGTASNYMLSLHVVLGWSVFFRSFPGGSTSVMWQTALSAGRHHLAGVWSVSGNYARVLVDGIRRNATVSGASWGAGATINAARIGAKTTLQTDRFTGKLAHVMLFDEPLADEEIAYLAQI